MDWLDRLKWMKESKGASLKEIADKSGIPLTTIEKIFCNVTKDPKLQTVIKVVECLGYTLGDLVDTEEAGNTNAIESALKELRMIPENYTLTAEDVRFVRSLEEAAKSWFSHE